MESKYTFKPWQYVDHASLSSITLMLPIISAINITMNYINTFPNFIRAVLIKLFIYYVPF